MMAEPVAPLLASSPPPNRETEPTDRQQLLSEVLEVLSAELLEVEDPAEDTVLRNGLALLLWDGQGRADAALAALGAVQHPVALALRVQARLEGRPDAPSWPELAERTALAAQNTGSPQDQLDLAEGLLWRGEVALAGPLLSALENETAAPDPAKTRVCVLWLLLEGRTQRAQKLLFSSPDGRDVLWATTLQTDPAGQAQAQAQDDNDLGNRLRNRLAVEPVGVAGLADRVLQLRWIEAQLAQFPAHEAATVLQKRFTLLGGESALLGASPKVELLVAALELATANPAGPESGSGPDPEHNRGPDLLLAVEQALRCKPQLAAPLALQFVERQAAHRLEAIGRLDEAATHWRTLAERLLADLPPPASETPADEWTRALALSALHRCLDLWLRAVAAQGEAARNQALAVANRLAGMGSVDETVALNLAVVLWQGGDRSAAVSWLWSCAQACAVAHGERLGLFAHAIRAQEAVGGGPAHDVTLHGLEQPLPKAVWLALARHFRRQRKLAQLLPLYRSTAAQAQTDERAAYRTAALALGATLGPQDQDEDGQGVSSGDWAAALYQAAGSHGEAPGRVILLLTQVLLCQQHSEAGDLLGALWGLFNEVRSEKNKLRVLKQLALHCTEIGDFSRAEASYQEVLERDPSDVVAMHALSRILSQRGEAKQALALLETAVSAALSTDSQQSAQPLTLAMLAPRRVGLGADVHLLGNQAAALLACELGALYEQQAAPTHDEPGLHQALAAYESAMRTDPRCRTAARALVVLYRTLHQKPQQLSAMRKLLPLLHDDTQRFHLLLELGHLGEELAQTPDGDRNLVLVEQAISAYSEALHLSPSDETTLERFINLALREERFGLLAETLERAPQTPQTLHVLALSYEKLGQPDGVAKNLEALWPLLTDQDQQIAALLQLTELYDRLEQTENSMRVWEHLYALSPDTVLGQKNVLLGLEHRLGASGRHAERAKLLQAALARLQQGLGDAELERHLLIELGRVLQEFLQKPDEAKRTFEEVLTKWPDEKLALSLLLPLYSQAGQPNELRRALTALLGLSPEAAERSRYLFQLGELCDKQGEGDEAYRLFGEAFFLDPANRGAFTAFERACYRRQKWPEVLRMYDTALRLIETQKTRSYRPADLYLRRGQVQLQYLQQVDTALASYLKALESDAENDATQATLERIYAGRNEWHELLAAYERRAQLVRDDGKRVDILRRAARVATAKLRDVGEAVRFREKLLAADPTDVETLDELERHYESVRDFEKLVALLANRVTLAGADEQLLIALHMRIGLLCEEGLRDHDRAISAYRHVVEAQATHREALDAMARLLEANERWTELVEVTRRQIRLVTDRQHKALLYFKCGSVTEAKFGKEDEAIRYYEAAVRTSAACLPALHSLRDIYVRREDYVHVTQTLELEAKLWTDAKEQAGILAHIGQIYLDKLHKPERAIEYYERALGVDRDCLPAHRALFHVYYQRGDYYRTYQTGQVLLARAAREGEPSERSAFHTKRAHAAAKVGELRIACESVVQALEIWPQNLAALRQLGSLCLQPKTGYDLGPTCRELEKHYRRNNLNQQLALLLCAQAALAERATDIDAAQTHYEEALRLLPDDMQVVEVVAGAFVRLARWGEAVALLQQFIDKLQQHGDAAALPTVARCEFLLAGLFGEVLLQPETAVSMLRQCIEHASRTEAPAPEELVYRARFRLVQELFVLGRYLDARTEIDSLLAIVAPESGAVVPPPVLCRYVDFQGRVLEALGDMTAAQQAYLRAIDLDSTYAPPLLQLARWGVLTDNREQAGELLNDAISRVSERTATTRYDERASEILLRRALARLLTQSDPQAAVAQYQHLVELSADDHVQLPLCFDMESPAGSALVWKGTDDSLALARVFLQAVGDTTRAEQTLSNLLRADLRCAEAYPLLAEVYERKNELLRARRVRTVSALLGYSAPEKRPARSGGYRGVLSEELRQRLLLLPALRGSLLVELLQAMFPGLLRVFPPQWPWPTEPTPALKIPDPGFVSAVHETLRLFGVDAEVLVAHDVPHGAQPLELASGQRLALLDQSVLALGDNERRFLLGRTLEPLRGGYATLLRLSANELSQAGRLLSMLLLPPTEQPPDSREFFQLLPRRSQQVFERAAQQRLSSTILETVAGFSLCADRAGLLAADDMWAAASVLGRLQGDGAAELEHVGHRGMVLGHAPNGAELLGYYLSDTFHELTQTLREASRL